MDYRIELPFNRKPATIIHLDLNSCFASVEQQANPLLRGKPVAVAAYDTPLGCIIAPSVEAKATGVKLGMRVKEGRVICPELIVLKPDPDKYRYVHRQLKKLLEKYTSEVVPKSIDEFRLNLEGFPCFKKGMMAVGQEIKEKIKAEVGDWLRVSVGIGPNWFLAKTASNLKKPDGLEEINYQNFETVYPKLALTDLCGIKRANMTRLNAAGIYTVMDFYRASVQTLRSAFESVLGYYWYLRLRGWEIDDVVSEQKSFGAMYSLPQAAVSLAELGPILNKLTSKTAGRMRKAGFRAGGIHLALLYRDRGFWHRGKMVEEPLFDDREIYRQVLRILTQCPYSKPVANLAVSLFDLSKDRSLQLDLFGQRMKKFQISEAVDKINNRYGSFVITPGTMLSAKDLVPDRIGFGGIRDLGYLD